MSKRTRCDRCGNLHEYVWTLRPAGFKIRVCDNCLESAERQKLRNELDEVGLDGAALTGLTSADVEVAPPSFTDSEAREALDAGHLAMHRALAHLD